ncbi:hypothetical protein ACTQ1U_13560 [Thermoguttaceae bacterium LCP21S3_D4]
MRIYKKYLRSLYSYSFILKSLVLVILCYVHDFTRYMVCRSVRDLFYWPEGPCLDMVVVVAFMIDALLILGETICKCAAVIKESENDTENP